MHFVKLVFLTGFLFVVKDSPAAQVDFTARIEGQPQITTESVSKKKIGLKVRITNRGGLPFSGLVRLKVLLFPDGDYPAVSSLYNGNVLGYTDVFVDLPVGKSALVEYSSYLPSLRRAHYFAAAIVNSNSAIDEADELNNNSGLFEVGEIEVFRERFFDFDLTTEVGGAFRIYSGGIGHELRTVVSGNLSFFPSSTYPARCRCNLHLKTR